jgi:hypothetical protein
VGVEKGHAVSLSPPGLATVDYRRRAPALMVCVIIDVSLHCTCIHCLTWIVGRGCGLTLVGGASVEALATMSWAGGGGHWLKLIYIMLRILGKGSLYVGGSRQVILWLEQG